MGHIPALCLGYRALSPSQIEITLRNAQVRRISWVRGVRPAWERHEWPPHDAASGRPPVLSVPAQAERVSRQVWNEKGAHAAPLFVRPGALAPLLDLGFAELDVLLRDRIVLLLDDLVGHCARVLPGHIVKSGIGARHQLDLDRRCFCHWLDLENYGCCGQT